MAQPLLRMLLRSGCSLSRPMSSLAARSLVGGAAVSAPRATLGPRSFAAAASTGAFITFDEKSQKLATLTKGKAVVYYTAAWCGPCRRIGPQFAELATKYPGISFVKVDIDDNEEAAKDAQIDSVPTFIFFNGGAIVNKKSGADPAFLTQACVDLSAL